jgi:ubiquinone/menaquinone biosynthesis C-methylase UbiE
MKEAASTENTFTMDQVREFWNSVAPRYDDQASRRVGLAHRRRFLDTLRFFQPKPGDRVLNVWCRTGGLTPYLLGKEKSIRLVQLELSDRLLEIARKKYPDQTFIQSSLDRFPMEPHSMDWVISLETLEHCPRPVDFLREIKRVLKPRGYLILSCPPRTSEPLAYLAYRLMHFHGEGPHRFLPSLQVKVLLSQSGFLLLQHEGTVLLPFGPEWLQQWVAKREPHIQNTLLRELCIRQFFLVRSQVE